MVLEKLSSTGAVLERFSKLSTLRQRASGIRLFCLYLGVIVGCVGLWCVPISRPLDLPSWHEFDDAAMARNFVREPSSILYPRIDWRKDGPGFTESEFPLLPWLMAQAYRVFGINVMYGRIVNVAAMLGTLLCFTMLARSLLSETGAVVALLLFGVNRVVNFVSTAVQPEALMVLFYVVAVYSFLLWRNYRSRLAYGCTCLALAAAILEKSPAAHLGIFFLLLLYMEEGWALLRKPANWALGALSLALPVIWYTHAHGLWITYGNSLGVSNESHWFGLDLLIHPKRPVGLVLTEAISVFGVGGLVLAILAMFDRRKIAVKFSALWYCSILIYYVVTLRTTGGTWAWYYHIVSIAPMALLAGSAVAGVLKRQATVRDVVGGAVASTLAMCALLWVVVRVIPPSGTNLAGSFSGAVSLADFSTPAILTIASAAVLVTILIFWLGRPAETLSTEAGWVLPFLCAAGLATYFFMSADLVTNDVMSYERPSNEQIFAQSISALIPEHSLIVASGGFCSESGHKIAFDNPYMFYWVDRKGFAICASDQKVDNVRAFAARGAQFYVAEKNIVDTMPGFDADLRKSFSLVAENGTGLLFDLRTKPYYEDYANNSNSTSTKTSEAGSTSEDGSGGPRRLEP